MVTTILPSSVFEDVYDVDAGFGDGMHSVAESNSVRDAMPPTPLTSAVLVLDPFEFRDLVGREEQNIELRCSNGTIWSEERFHNNEHIDIFLRQKQR